MEQGPPHSRRLRTRSTWRSFVSSGTYDRDWGAKTTLAVIFLSIGIFLGAAALVFALAVQPPRLAWIWFAIVSIVVLGLGGLAPLAFERTRVSPQRPAIPLDPEPRLLVIADSRCSPTALRAEIIARRRRRRRSSPRSPRARLSPSLPDRRRVRGTATGGAERLDRRRALATETHSDDGLGRERQAAGVDDRRARILPGDPSATGDTARGTVVLARAWFAGEGTSADTGSCRAHHRSNHPSGTTGL